MRGLDRLRARPAAIDVIVSAALTLAAQVEIWAPAAAIGTSGAEGSRLVLTLTSLLVTVPLAFRRTTPLVSCLLVMSGATLQALLATPAEGLTTLIALALSAFSVAMHSGRRAAVAGASVTLVSLVAIAGDLADAAFLLIVLGAPWIAGRLLRRRSHEVRVLDQHARRLEQEQEDAARLAVEAERSRIARELHDIVSHRVSTMVVQSQAADALLDTDPERARLALHVIDDAGRRALGELRSLLGLLRAAGDRPDNEPQPDLDRLGELIDEMRGAGVPVTLRVEGALQAVPAAVGVTAYRIVQEALTNVLKHAGSAPTEVTVGYDPGALRLVVADCGSHLPSGEPGYGLLGMQERAAHFGGTVSAGFEEGRGFSVRVLLPLEAAQA